MSRESLLSNTNLKYFSTDPLMVNSIIAKVKIMILGSNRAIEKLQLVKSVIILGKGTPGQAGYFEGRYEKVSGRL